MPGRFQAVVRAATTTVELRLGSPVGVLALHGGVEGGTAELASAVGAATGASVLVIDQPRRRRVHFPSHTADPSACAALADFLGHVDIVLSIHGHERSDDVFVGGANRAAAADVARTLREGLRWPVVSDLDLVPTDLRGLHPRNPVNLAAAGGVQLELGPRARGACGGGWHEPVDPPAATIDALARTVADLEGATDVASDR